MDQIPQGVTFPLVKTRAIDDVPMLGLTLWSENYDDYQLKQIAQELTDEIEKVNDVSATHKIGGRNRELRVVLDNNKLDQEIYYCGSEGVLTFNNLNQSKNEIQFAGNFSDIKSRSFYLISDDLQCNYLEDELVSTCNATVPFVSKYNRMEIKKYSCNS